MAKKNESTPVIVVNGDSATVANGRRGRVMSAESRTEKMLALSASIEKHERLLVEQRADLARLEAYAPPSREAIELKAALRVALAKNDFTVIGQLTAKLQALQTV